jgi:hypothetical protein
LIGVCDIRLLGGEERIRTRLKNGTKREREHYKKNAFVPHFFTFIGDDVRISNYIR